MDSGTYFHQYRRPRYNNPTYQSSNVQNSITFFRNSQNRPNDYYNNQPSRQVHNHSADNRYEQINPEPITQSSGERGKSSRLSNYGERLLQIDQRDVHNKQTAKYDILNFHPRQHNQAIKQYPRLTLENRDDVYYKKLNDMYNPPLSRPAYVSENSNPEANLAGKHTYTSKNVEPKEPPVRYNRFTPKLLNHMDELRNNLA